MKPLSITITDLNLDTVIGGDYEGGPVTLLDAIVKEAGSLALDRSDYSRLAERIRAIRDEEIRARVVAEIEAALTAPLQRTNTFGEATGPATTLRQQIADAAHQALAQPDRVAAYNAKGPTALQQLIKVEVEKVLADELRAAIADERARVVALIRAKAADLIATAVKEGIGS